MQQPVTTVTNSDPKPTQPAVLCSYLILGCNLPEELRFSKPDLSRQESVRMVLHAQYVAETSSPKINNELYPAPEHTFHVDLHWYQFWISPWYQNCFDFTVQIFLRCCQLWTKRYLITSQARVKSVSRIHHRSILDLHCSVFFTVHQRRFALY